MNNGKVFISHAHEDNDRCAPLLAALTAWGTDHWFDVERLDAGQYLAPRIQQAITERDVFIRVCTTVSQRSYWVMLETEAFRGLQAAEYKEGKTDRIMISLVLDEQYKLEPFERAAVYIDATHLSQRDWVLALAKALKAKTTTAQVEEHLAPEVVPASLGIAIPAITPVASSSGGAVLQPSARHTEPKMPPLFPKLPPDRPVHYPWIVRRVMQMTVLEAIGFLPLLAVIVLSPFRAGSESDLSQVSQFGVTYSTLGNAALLGLLAWLPAGVILLGTLFHCLNLATSFRWQWRLVWALVLLLGFVVFFFPQVGVLMFGVFGPRQEATTPNGAL